MIKQITQAELKRLLRYDQDTGEFTWLITSSNRALIGTKAGTINIDGRCQIQIHGRVYLAYRLAWLYVYGGWPKMIDHINGIKSDDRLINLRETTYVLNAQNLKRGHRDSTSGLLGVIRLHKAKKWASNIAVNGSRVCLGCFNTAEEAHAAYMNAKIELHPGFSLVGFKHT